MTPESPTASASPGRRVLLVSSNAIAAGLILASVDFLAGLSQRWAAEPDPTREFQSYATAAGLFSAAALPLVAFIGRLIRHRQGSPLLQRLGKIGFSGSIAIGVLTLALAWVRREMPDSGLGAGRGIPALLGVASWLAVLAMHQSRHAIRIRWAMPAILAALLLRALWMSPSPRLHPEVEPGAIPDDISRVLLITIDTLRADALGCYSGEGTQTPKIDALANRGVRYANAISPSPWTLPSLASLLTGVSVPVHQATSHRAPIPTGLPTLAERLRDGGFVTGAVGRNSFLVGLRGLNRGFQSYDMFPRSPKLAWPTMGGRLLNLLVPFQNETDVDTRRIADRAIEWMDVQKHKPFFLWVHFFDPHVPYAPPETFMPQGTPPPGMGAEFADVREVRDGKLDPGPEEREWIRELYLGEVRYVDEQVGRILEAVRQLPDPEKTLIILTSDHGEEFWEHGAFEHGHALYQEVIHVPLIVAHAGRMQPAVVEDRVNIESTVPTILEHLEWPFEKDEFSSPPLAHARPSEAEATRKAKAVPVFSTGILYGPDQEAVIEGDWKAIRAMDSAAVQLFHLEQDPGELNDRGRKNPEILQDTQSRLEDWRTRAAARRDQMPQLEVEPLELPEGTLQDLERLGYIN